MFQPKFTISNNIANALTTIERARGFLEAVNLSNEWVEAMQDKALALEAYYTTHIEGTELTLNQAEQIWHGEKVESADADDVKELLNYRKAFDLVSSYVGEGEIFTEGLIREIHKCLVYDVRGNSANPGEYRKIQNYVINSQTKKVIYTPPPAYEVSQMMSDLVTWINQQTTIHPVLVSGIAQFQLVHIHPFLDGNGRTARLLSTLCLYRTGYDFKKLFTISEYYDRNRADYYQALQSVREQAMDMSAWLEYFTAGLSTQLNEIKNLGKEAIERDVIAKEYDLSSRQTGIIEYLSDHSSVTIHELEHVYPDVSKRTLQRDLKVLLEKNLIVAEGSTNKISYQLVSSANHN